MIDRIRLALANTGAETSDFDLNADVVLPKDRRLRPAGVLAPIMMRDGDWHLILTKRSSALKHHPGQIAFPGGKQDEGDGTCGQYNCCSMPGNRYLARGI